MRFARWPNGWILALYVTPVVFIVALIVLPDQKLHIGSRPMWTHDVIMSLCGLWAMLLASVLVVRIGLAAGHTSSEPKPQGFEPVMRATDDDDAGER